MTIFDVSAKLYEYFCSNDTFHLNDNFKDIIQVSEKVDFDKQLIIHALKDFEEQKIIRHIVVPKKGKEFPEIEYWVLSKPLSMYPQTITISPNVALMIANTLNQFCDQTKTDQFRCDPKNITENSIVQTLQVFGMLLENVQKQNEEEEEKE